MSTWAESQELANSAIEDSDYYLTVQEKHMESMQAKVNSLQATIQEFWYNLIETDAINLGIDLLTGLIKVGEGIIGIFNKVGSVFGELGGQLGGLAGAATIIFSIAGAWDSFREGLSKAGDVSLFQKTISGIGGLFESFINLPGKAIESIKNLLGYFKIFRTGMAGSEAGVTGLAGGFKALSAILGTTKTALLGLGVGAAVIGGLIVAFDHFTDSTKETEEAVAKLSEQYENNQKTLKEYKKTTESISKEFATLSKGVNLNTGENISLTTDEYTRYQEITSQIAEMYPDLVKGFDAEGNAILKLKGTVEELNEVYDTTRLKLANEDIAGDNLDTYIENFKNKVAQRSAGTFTWDYLTDFGKADIGGRITESQVVDGLKQIQNISYDELKKLMNSGMQADFFSWASRDDTLGLKKTVSEEEWDVIRTKINSQMAVINNDINQATQNLKNGLQSYLTTLELQNADFAHIEEDTWKQVSTFISTMTADQIKEITASGQSLETYIIELVNKLNDNPMAQMNLQNILGINEDSSIEEIEKALDKLLPELALYLDEDRNKLKVQLGLDDDEQFIYQYRDAIKEIQDKFKDIKEPIDELYEESQQRGGNVNFYNRPIVDAQTMRQSAWSNFNDEDKATYYSSTYSNEDGTKAILVTPILEDGSVLTPESLDNYVQKFFDGEEIDVDIILGEWNGEDAIDQANKFGKKLSKVSKEFDLEGKSVRKIERYLKAQNIRSIDQLRLLMRCVDETNSWEEAIRRFELENISKDFEAIIDTLENGLEVIKTNIENINDAWAASNEGAGLSAEQIENIKKAYEGLEGYDYDKLFESTANGVRLNADELEKLNDEYERTEKAKFVDTLDDMQKEYIDLCRAISETTDEEKKNQLITKKNNLRDQIDQVQELASRYGGLTSAFVKWQNAQNVGSPSDMYDAIYEGIESIDELYQKGRTGDPVFKAYMQQFYNGDLDDYLNEAGKSYEEFYQENAAMIQRYFTEDTTGLVNFLNDLADPDKMGGEAFAEKFINEKGLEQWTIKGDIEEIAKSFGWATSTVDAFFKALESQEFHFTFEEKNPLDDLKAEVQDTFNKIDEEFKKKYSLKLDYESVEDAEEQLRLLEEAGKEATRSGNNDLALDLKEIYNYAKLAKAELEQPTEVEVETDSTINKLNECVNKLTEIGYLSEKKHINLNPSSIEQTNEELAKAYALIDEITANNEGKFDLSVEGGEEALTILSTLLTRQAALQSPTIMHVDASQVEGEMGLAIQAIQEYKAACDELAILQHIETQYGIDLDTTEAENKVNEALNNINSQDKDILAKLDIDPTSQTAMIEQIGAITPEMIVKAGVDEKLVKDYEPDEKHAKVIYDYDDTAVKLYDPPNINRTVTYTINTVGSVPRVDGTAHADGTAYAGGTSGNWGAKKDETALVGELGSELRVNAKTGKWELLGKDGAQFAHINKHDIIFNHKQTEELFKNGYVTSGGGRGKAFINGTIGKLNSLFRVGSGTAFAGGGTLGGSAGRWTTGGTIKNPSWNITPSENDSLIQDILDDAAKNVMDWIEILIDRIEREIDRLDTIASSAFRAYEKRADALEKEYTTVSRKIDIEQKAYQKYLDRANSVDLSEEYKQKIRDGKLQIEDINDEDLYEKIQDYQEWYEKALDCKYAVDELNEQLAEIVQTNFDNVVSEFDALLSRIQFTADATDKALSIVEAKGQLASSSYYEDLMATEQENLAMLRKEYAALQNAFKEAIDTGKIDEGSEAWYQMQEEIRKVESAIQDSVLNSYELRNKMWENDWNNFEKVLSYIDEITKESNFLIDLLSVNENDLFSKKSGKFTDAGMSAAALHAMDYNVAMANAEAYKAKVDEINKELAKDPTNTILIDKKNEYIEAQREAIKAANDEKLAIKSLIEESYNRMLEILQKLIDKRKEALQAEKDLYSYEKNIREQTNNITSLQKQLAALGADTSEENQAKVQQLQEELRKAQEDLQETEYDQWISDTEKLLDTLYSDYEEVLNERLDHLDELVSGVIDATNANADTIKNTINDAAGKVGYNISDGFNNVWNKTDSGVGKVVTEFSSSFTSTMTTTNSYIKSIRDSVNKIIGKSETEKEENKDPNKNPDGGGSSDDLDKSSSFSDSLNNSSSGNGNFFVYKYDSFPKDKLNINTSIIDRLKYHNFDSSWSNMAMYYEKMGLGSRSSYSGTYQQNVNMLNWMKTHGFKNSGQLKSMMATAKEDGLFLGRVDDHVLAKEDWQLALNVVEGLLDFAKFTPNVSAIKGMTYADNSENNITFNFNLPNVTDSNAFLKEIRDNKKVQQAIQSITIGQAMNGNSLDVKRFK